MLVAGSTSGIGLAITKMFISEGATVIGLGRNFDKTKDLGENYIPHHCDVTLPEEIEETCQFVDKTFNGKLDCFVDSAGLGVKQPVTDVPVDRFDLAINLLLRHHILFVSHLHPLLYNCDSKDPIFIHISSAASRSIESDNILYGLCKTACNLYAKQSAKGLHGIRSFTISPGTIATPIFNRDKNAQRSPEQIKAMFDGLSRAIPSGRVAEPSEVADLVEFLCSKDAQYMDGADCLIDGGIMTQF